VLHARQGPRPPFGGALRAAVTRAHTEAEGAAIRRRQTFVVTRNDENELTPLSYLTEESRYAC
jgi:hypothetical protein